MFQKFGVVNACNLSMLDREIRVKLVVDIVDIEDAQQQCEELIGADETMSIKSSDEGEGDDIDCSNPVNAATALDASCHLELQALQSDVKRLEKSRARYKQLFCGLTRRSPSDFFMAEKIAT